MFGYPRALFAGEMADGDLGGAIPWKRQGIFRKVVFARQIAEGRKQCLGGCFAWSHGLDDGKVMQATSGSVMSM